MNYYKKSVDNSVHFERLDTNSSFKERLDPIL